MWVKLGFQIAESYVGVIRAIPCKAGIKGFPGNVFIDVAGELFFGAQ